MEGEPPATEPPSPRAVHSLVITEGLQKQFLVGGNGGATAAAAFDGWLSLGEEQSEPLLAALPGLCRACRASGVKLAHVQWCGCGLPAVKLSPAHTCLHGHEAFDLVEQCGDVAAFGEAAFVAVGMSLFRQCSGFPEYWDGFVKAAVDAGADMRVAVVGTRTDMRVLFSLFELATSSAGGGSFQLATCAELTATNSQAANEYAQGHIGGNVPGVTVFPTAAELLDWLQASAAPSEATAAVVATSEGGSALSRESSVYPDRRRPPSLVSLRIGGNDCTRGVTIRAAQAAMEQEGPSSDDAAQKKCLKSAVENSVRPIVLSQTCNTVLLDDKLSATRWLPRACATCFTTLPRWSPCRTAEGGRVPCCTPCRARFDSTRTALGTPRSRAS